MQRMTFSYTGRREFLEQATLGFGSMALALLFDQDNARAADLAMGTTDLQSRIAHVPPRATSVIMLMQVGGPSHIDLFDPKPDLKKHDGEEIASDIEVLQPGSETAPRPQISRRGRTVLIEFE